MDTTNLHKFLNHRYRKWIVAGLSLVIIVTGGIPLTEELQDSKRVRLESQEAIRSISMQADSIADLRQQVEGKFQQVAKASGISQTQVSEYRDQCLQLVRKHQCRAESVSEGRTVRQPWNENLQPLVVSTTVVKEKPKYEVIVNSLNFTIAGELRHLVSLLEDLQSLHNYFVPAKIVLQQYGFENELKLEVEMALIELAKSPSAK